MNDTWETRRVVILKRDPENALKAGPDIASEYDELVLYDRPRDLDLERAGGHMRRILKVERL